MSELNLFDVDVQKDDDDAPGYHVSFARIGPLIDSRLLGLSVYELPPGQSICPYHYELGFEEWLIV
ncbi:MAG: Cupin 2 conserved barrel domain protein, partial [Actinomycetia bacterium]|nr:Cupin 2 conserved barrel domain protein [Actinomycetes bacterium]